MFLALVGPHTFFSPRLAYRTWLELDITRGYLEDDPEVFAERLPPCAESLFTQDDAFRYRFLDCFTSLQRKILDGQGAA